MISANQIRHETRSLLTFGDYEQALELAEQGVHAYSEDGHLWELHGIALGCRQRTLEAMASLERASTLVPLSSEGQLALAACYLRTHHLQSAECIYDFLVTRDDLPAPLMGDLAWGLDRVGKPEMALAVCQAAVRRVPDCHSAWFAMAQYLTKLGHPLEEIATAVRRAFELAPQRTLYRVDHALLLARCGRHEEAHRLLCEVDVAELTEVHCPPRLFSMLNLFRSMGDTSRANALAARILPAQPAGESDSAAGAAGGE